MTDDNISTIRLTPTGQLIGNVVVEAVITPGSIIDPPKDLAVRVNFRPAGPNYGWKALRMNYEPQEQYDGSWGYGQHLDIDLRARDTPTWPTNDVIGPNNEGGNKRSLEALFGNDDFGSKVSVKLFYRIRVDEEETEEG